jgi:hypothetical protein
MTTPTGIGADTEPTDRLPADGLRAMTQVA